MLSEKIDCEVVSLRVAYRGHTCAYAGEEVGQRPEEDCDKQQDNSERPSCNSCYS